jgi:TatD DNase family protein
MNQYANNIEQVIQESIDSSIEKIIVPSAAPDSLQKVIDLTEKFDTVYGALGIHPHESKHFTKDIKTFIESNLSNKKIIAVGESGLDFHYNLSPPVMQIKTLKAHIELADRFNLPLILHQRKAFDKMKEVLDSYTKLPPIVIHCFSGGLKEARYYIQKGFFISFTGSITFNKEPEMDQVLEEVPMDRLFLETDSPYLSPEPFRGKTNHPKHVKIIAEKIATVKGIKLDDVAQASTKNACSFFHLPFENNPLVHFVRDKTLYLNITNQSNNKLDKKYMYRHAYTRRYNLNLNYDPSIEELKEIIQNNILKIKDVVFLNHGEPTLRDAEFKDLATYAKSFKLRLHLDTDGLANKRFQRNFAAELVGLFDVINVDINAASAKEYMTNHRPPFGQESFDEVLNFVNECSKFAPSVIVRTVAMPGVDIKSCENMVKTKLNVEFKSRVDVT